MSEFSMGAASAAPTLAELADGIHEDLAGIQADDRAALAKAIAAGEKLIRAKALVAHGEWLPWLEQNFPGHQTHAARYMRLAQNKHAVLNFTSIREALASLPKKPRANTPSDTQKKYGNNHWENDEALAWVGKRMRAGKSRDEIFEESLAGSHGWPLPGRHLPKNTVDTCRAIVKDRIRRGDSNRPRPKESGKRLRELHDRKRGGEAPLSQLWNLQKAISVLVSDLEMFDLPDVEWDEMTQDMVLELFDDLERGQRWLNIALSTVNEHMDELGQQRKIHMLRKRVDDPSSTAAERQSAATLLERLQRKQKQIAKNS
jgi:hypothetical protein